MKISERGNSKLFDWKVLNQLKAETREQLKLLGTMESYTSYFYTLRRLPDFRVKYQLLPQADESPPYILQGTRFDFRYTNDGALKNSHYIIWPEFEDDGGFTILSKWLPIQPSGTAKMWIINQNLREYHRLYLKVGLVGYMTRGSVDIAICEVVELMNLGTL